MNEVDRYIALCEERILFHSQQGRLAKVWDNLLGISLIILSSTSGAILTILGVLYVDSSIITIVGVLFSVFLTILSKIRDSYKFEYISCLHNGLFDSFCELKLDLENSKKDEHVLANINLLTTRYVYIHQRSHIQTVNKCIFLSCCFR